jgi:hypothetical protein
MLWVCKGVLTTSFDKGWGGGGTAGRQAGVPVGTPKTSHGLYGLLVGYEIHLVADWHPAGCACAHGMTFFGDMGCSLSV